MSPELHDAIERIVAEAPAPWRRNSILLAWVHAGLQTAEQQLAGQPTPVSTASGTKVQISLRVSPELLAEVDRVTLAMDVRLDPDGLNHHLRVSRHDRIVGWIESSVRDEAAGA